MQASISARRLFAESALSSRFLAQKKKLVAFRAKARRWNHPIFVFRALGSVQSVP